MAIAYIIHHNSCSEGAAKFFQSPMHMHKLSQVLYEMIPTLNQ